MTEVIQLLGYQLYRGYLAQACEMCESYGQTQTITVCSQIINAIKAKKMKNFPTGKKAKDHFKAIH